MKPGVPEVVPIPNTLTFGTEQFTFEWVDPDEAVATAVDEAPPPT